MRKRRFCFLLLDVMISLVNGMGIVNEIRVFEKNIELLFISSTPEFAAENYPADAFAYLLKPATADIDLT